MKIQDNGEKLVDIEEICDGLIIDLQPKRKAYFRETVAKMICKAKTYLPKGITFIIGDAWRSREIQEQIHHNFYQRFKKENPDWSDKQIKDEIDKFVAPFEGENVSGHMTGGAVDLRLIKNGRKVPMKSAKLSYEENALSNQPKLSKSIQKNRQIMFDALSKAGLSNFPKEYWHWSYGDYWWAKRNNKKIIFYDKVDLEYENN